MRSPLADLALARGAPPIVLVTLSLADGRRVRVATAPVSVATANLTGDGPYQYDPLVTGIEDWTEEYDAFSVDLSGTGTSARIDVVTPEGWADAWLYLAAAEVEVATLWPGEAWEQRLILLDGAVSRAEIGVVGEASTFEVDTLARKAGGQIGDARIVGDEWPAPLVDVPHGGPPVTEEMTDLDGVGYQWVIGAPASVPAYKIGDVGGQNRLILAGHHFARTGASYPVTVYEDGVSVGSFVVTNGTTASGEAYAYVTSAADFFAADGAYTYHPAHGGMAGADGVTPALNAADVLEKLLQASGVAVEWSRMAPTLARLRAWPIGVWGDQAGDALDVVREALLPYLPLVEMGGGGKIWFAYVEPHLDPVEAVLTVGQDLLGIVGRVGISDVEAVRNAFVINYAFDPFTETYTQTATLNADNSALCYLSEQVNGTRPDDVIDCPSVHDPGTAMRVLTTRASRLATVRRTGTWLAAPSAYWLRGGMVVRVVDASRNVDADAVVVEIKRGAGPSEIGIECLDRTPFGARS